MAQYYYEKHNINDYWDTNNTGNIVESIDLRDNTYHTSPLSNTNVWISDETQWSYDPNQIEIKQTVHGYDDYRYQDGNYVTNTLFDNRSTAQVGDIIYKYENTGGSLENTSIIKAEIVNINYDPDFGTYDFYVDYKEEYILDLYTIYHHQEKGTYIETIVADDGAYPDDGIQDGYWWVKTTKPVVTLDPIGDKTVDEGQTLSYQVTASIDGASTITYSVEGLPEGASFDTSTGQFSWPTDYYDEGTYEVTFTASANGSTDSETITITVNHVDIEPILNPIGNKSVNENENLNFVVTVSDPDNVGYTLSATGLPAGAIFNTNTGEFDWTPTYFQSGSYQVTFDLTYTGGSDSETITITVNETHQPPTNRNPVQNYETNDRRPYFEFVLPANNEVDSNKYHAKLRVSTTTDMKNLVVDLDSKDDQSQWELWDGSQWVTFPATGVDPDSKVRVRPDYALQYGLLYWDCASWESSYGYGEFSTYWKLNVLISTEALYVLDINGVSYEAYGLYASETSNGEIGNINFSVNNTGGTANQNINYGDIVILAVNDNLGNQEQFKGVVRTKNPSGAELQVSAITGDGILAERRVKENYPAQDIGLTAKQIIDTYCAPLTSTNINTSTGIVAPVPANDKTALRVFEEIRRQHGIYYFVDANWDVHFYLPSEIASSVVTVRHGD